MNDKSRVSPSVMFKVSIFLAFVFWTLSPAMGICKEMPAVNLQFSTDYKIDQSMAVSRDWSKPFFFNLIPPAGAATGLSSYPFTVDIGTTYKIWLDKRVPPNTTIPNGRSLAIQITADRNEDKKDKIFFAVVPYRSPISVDIKDPNNRRYVAFDFMFDKSYEVPTFWAMHFQVWQCCGGHPPFTMNVTPGQQRDGPIQLTFGVRDDASERKPHYPETIIYSMTVKRAQWHNFVLELEPRPDGATGPGIVAMWFDGVSRFSAHVHWGHNPIQPNLAGERAGSQLHFDIGVYRRRQETTQTIYVDNIRFGRTLSEVLDPNY